MAAFCFASRFRVDVFFNWKFCAAPSVEELPDDIEEDQAEENSNRSKNKLQMLVHGQPDLVQQRRTIEDGNDSPDHEADELPGKDGSQEPERLHLKHACGKLEEFDRHRRRQHRRNHDCEKLLLLEAISKLLVTPAIDALEQEYLSACPPKVIRHKAANSGACRSHHAVENKAGMVVSDIVNQQSIDGNRHRCCVDQRKASDTPDTKGLQEGEHRGVPFMKERYRGDFHWGLIYFTGSPAREVSEQFVNQRAPCVLPVDREHAAEVEGSPEANCVRRWGCRAG